MSFKKQPLAFAPKIPAQADSWWTRPQMQTDRAAFQQHVVAEEIERMNNSTKFGSGRSTHDKFSTAKKR